MGSSSSHHIVKVGRDAESSVYKPGEAELNAQRLHREVSKRNDTMTDIPAASRPSSKGKTAVRYRGSDWLVCCWDNGSVSNDPQESLTAEAQRTQRKVESLGRIARLVNRPNSSLSFGTMQLK